MQFVCWPRHSTPCDSKKLKYCISKPLAMLFNQLVSVGYDIVSQEWLNATILYPVFKKVLLVNCVITCWYLLHVCLTKSWKEYYQIKFMPTYSEITYCIAVSMVSVKAHAETVLMVSVKIAKNTTNLESFNDWTLTIIWRAACRYLHGGGKKPDHFKMYDSCIWWGRKAIYIYKKCWALN